MAIELRQQLKLSQQLIMTPQLQMAIKLLQLSRLELLETINQELETNPALEETTEIADDDKLLETIETEKDSTLAEVTIEEKINDNIDWNNYLDEYNSTSKINFESEKKDSTNFDSFLSQKKSLNEHLLWQLSNTSPTEEEQIIGSLIIGNLNRDGYLDISLDELISQSGSKPEKVQNILSLMQAFDPSGVCAVDLADSLLIQARYLKLNNTLVTKIIKNHLNHLENRNYKAIVKALKVNIDSVKAAVNIITNLEPRPGRQFCDEQPQYIIPDIFVYKYDNDFIIMLNDDGMPKLRINTYYKNAIKNTTDKSDITKNYVENKLRSASWLIKSIHQRQKTIYKVMESLLRNQRDFFDKGIAYLKPMVLKDIAQDIDMHESTISRVTTNKYALTPQGIFELKFFFNSSINRLHGGTISSATVHEKIRKLIESENPQKPYSDEQISEILTQSNINIARRTIAKYRDIMKILSSSKRKQL